MHRIAILSAAGALALAGQANGAPVQCPSVSFTRTPIPASAHRTAHPKPHVQAAKHRAKPRKAGTVVAKRASSPVASNTLPVLAPILPPDTMPATTPVLAPGVQPATPILGYTLKRSVKMVACESVSPVTTARNQFITPPTGAATEASLIPTGFQPPVVNQMQTLPPSSPGGPNPPGGGGGGCCGTTDKPPPPPPGPVPEPATWAMLIVGFFGLGAQLRRSSRRAREAASA